MAETRIQVIDSHTGGEPTRIVIEGGPPLGSASLMDRRKLFRDDFDDLRRAIVDEPRGCDFLIGGLLCEPTDPSCVAGVIFFDTADYLGMCGHGMIGLVITLQHLGRIEQGHHRIETPVGIVPVELHPNNRVTIQNVSSYRVQKDVSVEVPEFGTVVGDIAWGGNWFFLVQDSTGALATDHVDDLLRFTKAIRLALITQGITGDEGAIIDHIELFGSPLDSKNDSRNFVLCPGGEYDRSPCGTGTSAKLACLAADGKLSPGAKWRQESYIGSVFECHYHPDENGDGSGDGVDQIIPTVSGWARVCGETTLILDSDDPFCMGIRQ